MAGEIDMTNKEYLMEVLAEYGITTVSDLNDAIASLKRPDLGVMKNATNNTDHKEQKK